MAKQRALSMEDRLRAVLDAVAPGLDVDEEADHVIARGDGTISYRLPRGYEIPGDGEEAESDGDEEEPEEVEEPEPEDAEEPEPEPEPEAEPVKPEPRAKRARRAAKPKPAAPRGDDVDPVEAWVLEGD